MAFYDLDGTLVSSDVVRRYAFYARSLPSKAQAILKVSKLLLSVPLLAGLDHYSRRLFNEVFYREYRGLKKAWLEGLAETVFQKVIRPSIYAGSKDLVDADREQGFGPVLVTGELDFVLQPVVRHFGFERLICNSLIYRDGAATGELVPPLIAGREKVTAIIEVCRKYNAQPAQSKAYSDSFSDVPLLEAVGNPRAVHPDRRLRAVAVERGWPILDLKRGDHVHVHRENSGGKVAGL
jgi:HAD superfamily hydrolase (TIGR01490 family)